MRGAASSAWRRGRTVPLTQASRDTSHRLSPETLLVPPRTARPPCPRGHHRSEALPLTLVLCWPAQATTCNCGSAKPDTPITLSPSLRLKMGAYAPTLLRLPPLRLGIAPLTRAQAQQQEQHQHGGGQDGGPHQGGGHAAPAGRRDAGLAAGGLAGELRQGGRARPFSLWGGT